METFPTNLCQSTKKEDVGLRAAARIEFLFQLRRPASFDKISMKSRHRAEFTVIRTTPCGLDQIVKECTLWGGKDYGIARRLKVCYSSDDKKVSASLFQHLPTSPPNLICSRMAALRGGPSLLSKPKRHECPRSPPSSSPAKLVRDLISSRSQGGNGHNGKSNSLPNRSRSRQGFSSTMRS